MPLAENCLACHPARTHMSLISPTDTPPDQILRTALWMSGAVASFSLMAVAGRAVSSELDTFEIMMYRSIIGFCIIVLFGAMTGALRGVTLQAPSQHLMRKLCHFGGQNLWFYAITAIPLAQVFALEFTSPLWVLVLSPLFLGEAMTRMRIVAALLGFAGILVVARPGAGSLDAGTLAAATAAIGFAGSIIFTKRLTRTASLVCILFWMTL